jgi:hypothetical protein
MNGTFCVQDKKSVSYDSSLYSLIDCVDFGDTVPGAGQQKEKPGQ